VFTGHGIGQIASSKDTQ